MAIYTQLNQQDIQSLADNYDLKIVEFSPLYVGNSNSSYILKTQQASYVLTVCDDKEFDEVFKMGQLLLFLEAHNMPCNRLKQKLYFVCIFKQEPHSLSAFGGFVVFFVCWDDG